MIFDRDIRQILAELELIQHGTITAYNSSGGGHGEREHAGPTGEEFPPHLHYRDLFEEAADSERSRLLEEARDALTAIRKRDRVVVSLSITDKELMDQRILDEGKGWSSEDVARHIRCSVTQVRKARTTAGFSAETGERVVMEMPGNHTQQERARLLLEQGLTERQVSTLTGLPKSSVRRAGGKAA